MYMSVHKAFGPSSISNVRKSKRMVRIYISITVSLSLTHSVCVCVCVCVCEQFKIDEYAMQVVALIDTDSVKVDVTGIKDRTTVCHTYIHSLYLLSLSPLSHTHIYTHIYTHTPLSHSLSLPLYLSLIVCFFNVVLSLSLYSLYISLTWFSQLMWLACLRECWIRCLFTRNQRLM